VNFRPSALGIEEAKSESTLNCVGALSPVPTMNCVIDGDESDGVAALCTHCPQM